MLWAALASILLASLDLARDATLDMDFEVAFWTMPSGRSLAGGSTGGGPHERRKNNQSQARTDRQPSGHVVKCRLSNSFVSFQMFDSLNSLPERENFSNFGGRVSSST